jgi:hypothetical protein
LKIIVYNYKDKFALSRKDIEIIARVLPTEYFSSIHEFHLTFDDRQPSIFEFSYEKKRAYFAFPVKDRTPKILSEAVEQLLIGLARIKAKSRFGQIMKKSEASDCQIFVETWQEKCLSAINSQKS